MKKCHATALSALFVYFFSGFLSIVSAQNREVLEFNDSWKFYKGDVTGAYLTDFSDTDWETVQLPHSWNNKDGQDGGSDYYRGVG